MTTPTTRSLRHRATVNMLRMGHCAPSIAQTLLDVTDQKKVWVVKLAAGMPGGIANTGYECGGNGLADHLNEFNRLTNRGHDLAAWFARECGSTLCRDVTQCDFANPEDVERYIAGGCINGCRSIAEKVAQKVEAMT